MYTQYLFLQTRHIRVSVTPPINVSSVNLYLSYHGDHESEVKELQRQKTELELQFPVLCVPDPDLAGYTQHTLNTPTTLIGSVHAKCNPSIRTPLN